ncbi:MAG: TonB-dependent receptor [Acidimicrobiia bacterium]|nr:TonB-dependent receptor [Acidimicrobiia bacterium]
MHKTSSGALLLAVGWLFSVVPVLGQSGATVGGTLTNSLTGEAVGDATVTLQELKRDARSSASGQFSFSDVPPGLYHLLVRADKFMPQRSEVVVSGTSVTRDLQIDPEMHYSEVLSVSPRPRNQFESYQPTAVLAGQDLEKERQPSLAETLQYEPGMAARSLGPGPARPVIRGLDGDRVLILQDGQRMGDLSSQSGDHGVNVNPASATRIEVVRGPATLLYGANAIGGLVNVIAGDVPTLPVSGAHGSVSLDAASAANEAGAAGDVTLGNGTLALHVSGSGRRASDYATPDGDVPNSFSRGGFAGAGLAWTSADGYFGGSVGYDKTRYGIPLIEDGETNLTPRRRVFTLRGERRNLPGLFESVRGSLGIRRYRHDELDGEEVSTQFSNNTTEFDLLARQRPVGRLTGSVGVWALGRGFATAGEEVLSPNVDQASFAGFLYEEVNVNPHLAIQLGGRLERSWFTPEASADEPERAFTNVSASVGLLVHPTEATTVAFNLARAVRNPALEELYFRGPHRGNFAFENGDSTLSNEKALGFDLSARWRGRRTSGEVTYFLNHIKDFIFREFTGLIEEDLPETFFTSGNGRLQGIESHVDFALTSLVSVEAGLDYVRGTLTSIDRPMPRIPPLRGRLGVRLQRNALQAGIDAVFTRKQDRIFTLSGPFGPVGETLTDGYGIAKVFLAYSFANGPSVSTITIRVDNVGDRLYRNHLNYLKDLVPEISGNLKVLYNVRF